MINLIRDYIYKNININNDFFIEEIKNSNIYNLNDDNINCIYDADYTKQMNIYLMLQFKCITINNTGSSKDKAYINYLLSYLIFVIITPPFSEELSLLYAENSVSLDNDSKYVDWLNYVKMGN